MHTILPTCEVLNRPESALRKMDCALLPGTHTCQRPIKAVKGIVHGAYASEIRFKIIS